MQLRLAATTDLRKPFPHAALVSESLVLAHLSLHPVVFVETELGHRVSDGTADARDGVQDSVHGTLTTNKMRVMDWGGIGLV